MTAPTGEALVPMYECRSKAERAGGNRYDNTITEKLDSYSCGHLGVRRVPGATELVVPKPPHGIRIKNAFDGETHGPVQLY